MIKGLGTALITPFKADGSVDYEALARVLDTQLTGFVDYLVVLGTTGEAATMTESEKREVRTFVRDYVKKSSIINHVPPLSRKLRRILLTSFRPPSRNLGQCNPASPWPKPRPYP